MWWLNVKSQTPIGSHESCASICWSNLFFFSIIIILFVLKFTSSFSVWIFLESATRQLLPNPASGHSLPHKRLRSNFIVHPNFPQSFSLMNINNKTACMSEMCFITLVVPVKEAKEKNDYPICLRDIKLKIVSGESRGGGRKDLAMIKWVKLHPRRILENTKF